MSRYRAPHFGENCGKRPTARRFSDAVVRVLGHRSGYTTEPQAKSRSLEVQILGVGGVNPCLPMPDDWFLDASKPKGRAPGLLRVVQWAFRNLREGYISDTKPALCVAVKMTITVDDKPRVVDGWALTEAGVERARELLEQQGAPGGNWTTLHMGALMDAEGTDKVVTYLTKKLGKSRTLGQIHDHLNNYLTRMMKTDGWFSKLYAGQPPTIANVKGWAYKQACSDLEGAGRNPASRALHGASTARDRNGERDLAIPVDGRQVVSMGEDSDGSDTMFASRNHKAGSGPLVDVVDIVDIGACVNLPGTSGGTATFENALDGMAFAEGMANIEAAIRRYKPTVWERYLRVVHGLQDQMSTEEIAQMEDVSRNRGANIIAAARKALRMSRADGQVAIEVLTYCDTEPYATLEDLQADVKPVRHASDGALDIVIEWHLEHGHLDEVGGSFLVTPAGRAMMRSVEADPKMFFLT